MNKRAKRGDESEWFNYNEKRIRIKVPNMKKIKNVLKVYEGALTFPMALFPP